MKKYISILALFTVVLLTNCSDQLDRAPIDALQGDATYRTVGDLQNGLTGAIGNYNPGLLIAHNSIFTDNVQLGTNNGGQELNGLNQVLNADQGDRGLWTSHYGALNDFNRVLEAAGGITPTANEQTQYNNILAQCYAFRALLHYDLLLYYGLDIRDRSALGVPYVDYVSIDAKPTRDTTGDVIDAINADLDRTLALLPTGFSDINFATRDFVTFLRARIALETGDNQGAIDITTPLISSGRYPLANTAQYLDMFREDANTTEVVWKYDSVLNFNLGLLFTWNFTGPSPFIEMSDELFGLLDDNDIRKDVLVDVESIIDEGVLIIGKYPENSNTQAINDFKAMRISEAYLIRAEAYAKLNLFGQAAADVFSVRNARTIDGVADPIGYGNQLDAITDIILERRKELAYEGHRYNDIKRVRSFTNEGIERSASDCTGAVPCTLPVDSPKWIFPIPTSELNGNPNIRSQQAPGY